VQTCALPILGGTDPLSAIPYPLSARHADQRLHMIEVLLQRPPPGGGQRVLRPRHPTLERLLAREVARVLELAGVDADVAVRRLQHRLQLVEAERRVHGQRADDAEARLLVNEALEIGDLRLP